MNIKALRNCTNMSQRSFSEYFGIPIGTLRNWEQGISSPPEYVYQMIFKSIRRDEMINVETIKFLNMLNELAEMSANGIEEFSNATSETFREKVFYNEKKEDENGQYKIVLDACLSPEHHDAVSYYGEYATEYTVRIVIDENDKPYIEVRLIYSGEEIIIENGHWYFVDLCN